MKKRVSFSVGVHVKGYMTGVKRCADYENLGEKY